MNRRGLVLTTQTLLALVAIGTMTGAAAAADRTVLGEFFTATW